MSDMKSFESWLNLFDDVDVDQCVIEEALASGRAHKESINALLQGNKYISNGSYTRFDNFEDSLTFLNDEYRCGLDFTQHEYELIKRLIKDQQATRLSWSNSDVVTSILYNAVVLKLQGGYTNLNCRDYQQLHQYLQKQHEHIASKKENDEKSISDKKAIFTFRPKSSKEEYFSDYEKGICTSLFALVRSPLISKKKDTFCQLYDFASCVCDHVYQKSDKMLRNRYDAISTKVRRMKKESTTVKFFNVSEALQNVNDVSFDADDDNSITDNVVDLVMMDNTGGISCVESENAELGVNTLDLTSENAVGAVNPMVDEVVNVFMSGAEHDVIENVDALKQNAQLQSWSTWTPSLYETLVELYNSYPKNTVGKLDIVYNAYKELYPNSPLTKNAVVLKIRRRVAAKTREKENSAQKLTTNICKKTSSVKVSSTKKTTKKRACVVCASQRKACGIPNRSPVGCLVVAKKNDELHQDIRLSFQSK
jgi:hypothetical protein